MAEAWKCYARPAWRNGVTCGHLNSNGGIQTDGDTWCESCGCTKHASELRRRREEEKARRNEVGA